MNGKVTKCEIPPIETVRKLSRRYQQEKLEKMTEAVRNEVVRAISCACTCGRYTTEIKVNSDDPTTIKVWAHIGAELANLNYQHTYNWEADRSPRYLISTTIRWDESEW